MRILLINQFYKPDTAATGQLLADLAEELAAHGHEVHVICSRRTYSGDTEVLTAVETINGVRIHRVAATGFGRGTMAGRIVDWLSFFFLSVWRALRLVKMDVCVSLTTPPFIAMVGLILSKFKGTRSVIWVMDVYPDIAVAYDLLSKEGLLYRILTWLNNVLYCNAVAIISIGDVMTEQLRSLRAPKHIIHTVHNWVPGETLNNDY